VSRSLRSVGKYKNVIFNFLPCICHMSQGHTKMCICRLCEKYFCPPTTFRGSMGGWNACLSQVSLFSVVFLFNEYLYLSHSFSRVPGGSRGFKHPKILKALQNRAKLNPIVKTVKNCSI
jgi:hypothetical protein